MSYGPVMILTGGDRGIGAATARLAAGRGYAVCVNYLSGREAADEVVKEITTGGGRAEAMQADVSVEAEVESLFRRVDAQLGYVAALVNNAATLETQMRVDAMDAARISRMR